MNSWWCNNVQDSFLRAGHLQNKIDETSTPTPHLIHYEISLPTSVGLSDLLIWIPTAGSIPALPGAISQTPASANGMWHVTGARATRHSLIWDTKYLASAHARKMHIMRNIARPHLNLFQISLNFLSLSVATQSIGYRQSSELFPDSAWSTVFLQCHSSRCARRAVATHVSALSCKTLVLLKCAKTQRIENLEILSFSVWCARVTSGCTQNALTKPNWQEKEKPQIQTRTRGSSNSGSSVNSASSHKLLNNLGSHLGPIVLSRQRASWQSPTKSSTSRRRCGKIGCSDMPPEK